MTTMPTERLIKILEDELEGVSLDHIHTITVAGTTWVREDLPNSTGYRTGYRTGWEKSQQRVRELIQQIQAVELNYETQLERSQQYREWWTEERERRIKAEQLVAETANIHLIQESIQTILEEADLIRDFIQLQSQEE